MTNKELQEILKTYPEEIEVYTEYEGEFFEIKKYIICIENDSRTNYKDVIVIW